MRVSLTISIPVFFSFLLVSCSPITEELYVKAEKFQEQKEYKKAIEVYTKISKRNSKFQDVVFSKGYCYFLDSNYTKALHYYDFVLSMKGAGKGIILEMNPDGPFASEADRHQVPLNKLYHHIGIVKYYMDSLSASYGFFQHLINLNYETSNCLVWQGLIWTRLDSNTKACNFFQKAKDLGESEADKVIKIYCLEKSIK